MHPVHLSDAELLDKCREKRVRRSGPGGQHRNKVETGIVLIYEPAGLTIEASEKRSQAENRKAALRRLRLALALEVRIPRNSNDTPSDLWTSRCRDQKILINSSHDDYPALLAEALDWVAVHEFDLKAVGERLSCSTSQLVKLLKKEPRALPQVNRQRKGRGLSEYR